MDRFTIWTDEVLWKRPENGLSYGVWDNHKDEKHYIEGWVATNRQEAVNKAKELNEINL